MEALTISPANLNIIEENIKNVAKELSGVINEINNVNAKVNNVESNVLNVNNGLNNVVEEIRSNTIVNNARQSILYNNSIIEKKFGYYDILRRKVEAIIENLTNNTLNKSTLNELKKEIAANNPRYWLANASLSVIYWLNNNKQESDNQLNEALRKNKDKTSLFMLITYLILNRKNTAINWLKYYLNHQDPTSMSEEFITILDLVSNGTLGMEGIQVTNKKIEEWINKLNSNSKDNQVNKWIQILNEHKEYNNIFNYINDFATNFSIVKDNISIYSAIHYLDDKIDSILELKKDNKSPEKVIYNLIYDYEDTEKIYQLDNLRNELLIQTNGNKEDAEALFNKQKQSYENNNNLLDILYNTLNNPDKYNISSNTIKCCLVYQKEYIIKALNNLNNSINKGELIFNINDIMANTKDGKDIEKIKEKIRITANSKYIDDEKPLIILLIMINLVSLIAAIIITNNSIINILILSLIFIINIIVIIRLNKKSRIINEQKKLYVESLTNIFEKNYAECTDYDNIKNKELEYFNLIINKLNSLKIDNVIVLKERNIDIPR